MGFAVRNPSCRLRPCPAVGLRRLSWAPAVVAFRYAAALPHAVVGVGLAVAAADRPEDPRADARNAHARAAQVEHPARAGAELAEQPPIAANGDDTAAELAETGRRRATRRKQQQTQADRQRRNGVTNQARSHPLLPNSLHGGLSLSMQPETT